MSTESQTSLHKAPRVDPDTATAKTKTKRASSSKKSGSSQALRWRVSAIEDITRLLRWGLVALVVITWLNLTSSEITTMGVACLEAGHSPEVCGIEPSE